MPDDFDVPKLQPGEFSDPNMKSGCFFDDSTSIIDTQSGWPFDRRYLLNRRYCNRFRKCTITVRQKEIEKPPYYGVVMDTDGEMCWFAETVYQVTYEVKKENTSIYFEDWRHNLTLKNYYSAVTGAESFAVTAGTDASAAALAWQSGQAMSKATPLISKAANLMAQANAMGKAGNRMAGFVSLEGQALLSKGVRLTNAARRMSTLARAGTVLGVAETVFVGGTYFMLRLSGGIDKAGSKKVSSGWELYSSNVLDRKETGRSVLWVPISEKFPCPESFWKQHKEWKLETRPEGAGKWYPPEKAETEPEGPASYELLEYEGPEFEGGFAEVDGQTGE